MNIQKRHPFDWVESWPAVIGMWVALIIATQAGWL